jgi:hypothetical protein
MVVLGVLLVLAGFITALPSGSSPGSIARRNLGLGMRGIHRTLGDQERATRWSWRGTLVRVGLGVLLVGAGVVCLATTR